MTIRKFVTFAPPGQLMEKVRADTVNLADLMEWVNKVDDEIVAKAIGPAEELSATQLGLPSSTSWEGRLQEDYRIDSFRAHRRQGG